MGWGVMDYPGEPPQKPVPVCPVCGWDCNSYFINSNGEVIGCENCVKEMDAYEWREENE